MIRSSSKITPIFLASALALAGAPAFAQYSGNTIKIGFITDLSSAYADVDGPGGVEAIRLAIEDFGGEINGHKIELLFADHQHKADIASAKAREWFDQAGLDMLIAGTNSATGLAMAKIASDKKRPLFAVGPGTTALTNEQCNPYTIQYAYDTTSVARGIGKAVVEQGGKSWYFLTADYAYGISLETEMSKVVKDNGGTVLGAVRHPLSITDFSSFILQVSSAKPQVIGFANAGNDLINSIKAANEFQITKNSRLAATLMFETDVHALGLELVQGMYTMAAWYWDHDEQSKAWAKRFMDKTGRAPSFVQAGNYSATRLYLETVKKLGTDNPQKVLDAVRGVPINDMFIRNGVIRPDGLMVHDMYLLQAKSPAESKYPWDYFKVMQTIPGDAIFRTKAESVCGLWK
jgi:branched-chain amino acid transport system substrate-binding protein